MLFFIVKGFLKVHWHLLLNKEPGRRQDHSSRSLPGRGVFASSGRLSGFQKSRTYSSDPTPTGAVHPVDQLLNCVIVHLLTQKFIGRLALIG